MDASHVPRARRRPPAHGRRTQARLSDDDPLAGCVRVRTYTIADAAKLYGNALLLVVLTGMGEDGREGAGAVKKPRPHAGRGRGHLGRLGMPGAIAEAGLADEILPLHELPAAIAREAGA